MNRIEELFGQTLEAVECLQEALNVSLADALVETFDNLESGEIRVEMGAPDQKTVAELEERYAALDYKNWSKAQKEQVYGLLVLKAVNDDGPGCQPDADSAAFSHGLDPVYGQAPA